MVRTPKRAFHIGTTDWQDPPSPVHDKSSSSSTSEGSGSFFNNSGSTSSSRSTTPEAVTVDLAGTAWANEKKESFEDDSSSTSGEDEGHEVVEGGVGRLPDEVYDKTLSWWRAGIRRQLAKSIEWESQVLAAMQKRIRTPFLDSYFVYTSSLGTHTFFMTVLPAFFFFGYEDVGRGLLFVLAFGVYASSFVKDLICSPRPYAPPVTRLTIGTHHLEYGFPSTHSTNSMSIALYLFSQVHRLYNTPLSEGSSTEMMISSSTYWIMFSVLAFYTFSIVFGRLYTAMHSFTDCVFGVLLGASIWASYLWIGPLIDLWVKESGWIVPAVSIPLCLLMVHRHPQPVDDCPCFEDAIAFVSVILGDVLFTWFRLRHQFDKSFFVKVMDGQPIGTPTEMWTWWSIAAAKMIIGVMAIFAWRIFAKFLCHRILPPTFRLLSQLFTLPRRRFYTPATDYKNVPQDKHMRTIPSVIDLPGMVELEVDSIGATTAHNKEHKSARVDKIMKLRNGKGGSSGSKLDQLLDGSKEREECEECGDTKGGEVVKHYDADVLTKVFVYCGIGIVATNIMPIVFEVVGWGLHAV